ncbi:MAG: glycosyltransferase family 4 protein [Desulfonauticus sp.]|nr:glycosyltransferase family 4 protein [Desulfonauticus sp.]
MLNILYVTPAKGRSGGVRQLLYNIDTIGSLGHKVYLCCHRDALILKELPSNIPVFYLPKSGYETLKLFSNLVKNYHIDVVHCFHSKLYKLFLLIKFFSPNFKLFFNRGVIFKPGSFPLLWLPQLDGIICNSIAAAHTLKKYLVSEKKIHVVYNAVHIPDVVKTTPDKFTITYVGNKRPYKGVDVFLKSIAQVFQRINASKVRVNVAGIASNNLFKQYVNTNVLSRINFLGGMEHKNILKVLSSSNILVITSRQESLPNVLLEAYSLGLAVIATKTGGIPEILKDKINGFLCPIEDVQCIARRIVYLYDNPEVADQMGKYNLIYAKKKFNPQIKAKKLLSIYNSN